MFGVHFSQTYDLPDMVKSLGALGRFVVGGSVVPKKKRRDDEDNES